MYELEKAPFGQYTRYTLHHPATRNAFSIVPERGANLLDLTINGQHVLDGYHTPEELELAKFGKSAVLFPFPNRLDRGQYDWLGKRYQFPINNASTENAIHGFVRNEAFEVDYIFLAKDHASILCSLEYAGGLEYYPFPFTLQLEFMLHDSGAFSLEVVCRNNHDTAIPVGFGWHPYFQLTEKVDDHFLQLPLCEKVVAQERMIPTGERTAFPDFLRKNRLGEADLDTCFHLQKESGAYKMLVEAKGKRLKVSANGKQFPFFQVFTPPHRNSIALEPMSCNVDAFHNGQGLVTLEPGREWKGKIGIGLEG
ncbi:MAG: hypothetical protein ABIO24_06575 [Saprospiraceae bacterium]